MVDTVETIVAVATPPGRGAVGIVRVSGPLVKEVITSLIQSPLSPRVSTLCRFHDENSRIVDEGLAVYFPAPGSFTGEDVLEIYAHGSRVVLDLIMKVIIQLGARQAHPGEFTERAFHNNKLDLIQAEAIAALIEASSEQAARSAMRSLEGDFSRQIKELLGKLIEMRVFTESALDFPDEETEILSEKRIKEKLGHSLDELTSIINRAKQGAVLKEGATVVIVGVPNAGKSTLLNKLAGREAAIVTEIPGTTRDLITQDILLDGIPLHIIDTAGLRTTRDVIEQEGMRRAMSAVDQADIVILVNEYNQPFSEEENAIIKNMDPGKHLITLKNKIDLHNVMPGIQYNVDKNAEILLSAKTGQGLEVFVSHLKNILGMQEMQEDAFIARSRHVDALKRVAQHLQHALDNIEMPGSSTELLAEDLRLAQQALGEITGEFASDDLLGEIFSTFCIGK